MSSVSLKLNPDLMGRASMKTATVRELYELKAEGLIGENSGAIQETNQRDSYDEPIVQQEKLRFWSDRSNTQWWAMMEDGAVGQQAAGYLAQMTTEKRQAAADYLASFNDLSDALQMHLSDMEGADGSSVEPVDKIAEFWQANQAAISDVENRYDSLRNFPQHLSEWLDEKQIDRTAELDAMVSKHRYSGLNGLREHSDALLGSFRFNIRDGDQAQMMVPSSVRNKENFSLFEAIQFSFPVHGDYTKRRIEMALRMGDAGAMKNALATGLMQQEQQSALAKYSNIYATLSSNISTQMQGIEPSLSLQKILDNLAEGKAPATLSEDNLPPEADKTNDIVDKYASLINAVQAQQQQFETAPKSVSEWLSKGENNQMLDQMVYNQFGLEPWEAGSNSRLLRGAESGSMFSFYEHGDDDFKQKILDEAVERRDRLERELFRYTGGQRIGS